MNPQTWSAFTMQMLASVGMLITSLDFLAAALGARDSLLPGWVNGLFFVQWIIGLVIFVTCCRVVSRW